MSWIGASAGAATDVIQAQNEAISGRLQRIMAQLSAGAEDERLRYYWRLPNGVVVLKLEDSVSFGPGAPSVTVGFWFGVGVVIAASAAAGAVDLAASRSCMALAFASVQDLEVSTRSVKSVEVMGMS